MLKEIEIKNFSFKMILRKTGNYSKHELKVFGNLKKFIIDNDNKKIEKVYTDKENKNVIFIKYEGESIIKTYYLDRLELF